MVSIARNYTICGYTDPICAASRPWFGGNYSPFNRWLANSGSVQPYQSIGWYVNPIPYALWGENPFSNYNFGCNQHNMGNNCNTNYVHYYQPSSGCCQTSREVPVYHLGMNISNTSEVRELFRVQWDQTDDCGCDSTSGTTSTTSTTASGSCNCGKSNKNLDYIS